MFGMLPQEYLSILFLLCLLIPVIEEIPCLLLLVLEFLASHLKMLDKIAILVLRATLLIILHAYPGQTSRKTLQIPNLVLNELGDIIIWEGNIFDSKSVLTQKGLPGEEVAGGAQETT